MGSRTWKVNMRQQLYNWNIVILNTQLHSFCNNKKQIKIAENILICAIFNSEKLSGLKCGEKWWVALRFADLAMLYSFILQHQRWYIWERGWDQDSETSNSKSNDLTTKLQNTAGKIKSNENVESTFIEAREYSGTPSSYLPVRNPPARGDQVITPSPAQMQLFEFDYCGRIRSSYRNAEVRTIELSYTVCRRISCHRVLFFVAGYVGCSVYL